MGRDERELLVWYHRMNLCSLKYLLRLSKRVIISINLSKIRKLSPCDTNLLGNYHKMPWRTKGKHSSRSIRKPS